MKCLTYCFAQSYSRIFEIKTCITWRQLRYRCMDILHFLSKNRLKKFNIIDTITIEESECRRNIGITKVKYKCYCLSISINYHITYIPFIHTEWNENLEGIDHEPMVIVDEIHGPNANGEKYMKRLYELILNTRNDKWFKLNLTTDQTEAYKIDHLPQAKMYRHNFHTFITYFLNFKYFCHFYHFCDF